MLWMGRWLKIKAWKKIASFGQIIADKYFILTLLLYGELDVQFNWIVCRDKLWVVTVELGSS